MNRSHSVKLPRQCHAQHHHRDREFRHRNSNLRSATTTTLSGPTTTKAAPAMFTINTDPLLAHEPDSNHHQRCADLQLRPTPPLQQREQDAFSATLQH
ncbi:hypothetical protein DEO72_LG11g1422 [Vigna unguiculata]|uniref:Uncharacterized protein n=1 Tax=Vigna unguiculata TaxID=3917 RepID=A0A4D6NN33_VIGUN|nr:hypothetical protein DEO72_LG11g1422 [Vigna unguiculata]